MQLLKASHPFALMMEPEAVVQAMERSDRLQRLQRRVCRPLDKPLIPRTGARVIEDAADLDADDEGDALGH